MDELISRLENIEKRLENIEKISELNAQKIGLHIDFVESIYSKIKMPFHYIMDAIGTKVIEDQVDNDLPGPNYEALIE
jgi:hypothetical protein